MKESRIGLGAGMSGANGRKLSQDGLPPGSQEQTDLTDIYTVRLPENIQKTSSQRSPETDIGDTDRQIDRNTF